MKKFLTIILALSVLLLTSCGDGNSLATTTDAITTVDPVEAFHEKRNCFKLIVTTSSDTFKNKDDRIVNEGPTDKESLFKLTEKFINTLRMYDYHGFIICIEWSGIGTGARELISKIESEFSVKVSESHITFFFEDYDLPQSEFYEKVSELLYDIVSNECVARVYLTDVCPHRPVPA